MPAKKTERKRMLQKDYDTLIRTGRPRTQSPEPEECLKLGEEMIDWVKQNKPTHLTSWWSVHKMIAKQVWDKMIDVPEFRPYYDIALNMIAENHRDGTLDKSLAQRFLALYHKDLRDYDKEELDYRAKLAEKEAQSQRCAADDILDRLLDVRNKV